MITMSREEMIEKAKQTRLTAPRPTVSQAELDHFPADVKPVCVKTRAGSTQVHVGRPIHQIQGGPLIINLHGGGFIKEWTKNDELFCRQILNRVGGCTVDIEYHLAPDYPFPMALHESYDVTKWAIDHAAELGADPDKLVIIGHSSGGNLTAGICLLAKERQDFVPELAIFDYPPMDLYTNPADKKYRGGPPPEVAELYNLYYCDRAFQKDLLVSPVFAALEQLKGFPASLVITAEHDTLCIEGEEFALHLAQAGTEVTVKRIPGVTHGFVIRRQPGYLEVLNLMECKIREIISKHTEKTLF